LALHCWLRAVVSTARSARRCCARRLGAVGPAARSACWLCAAGSVTRSARRLCAAGSAMPRAHARRLCVGSVARTARWLGAVGSAAGSARWLCTSCVAGAGSARWPCTMALASRRLCASALRRLYVVGSARQRAQQNLDKSQLRGLLAAAWCSLHAQLAAVECSYASFANNLASVEINAGVVRQ